MENKWADDEESGFHLGQVSGTRLDVAINSVRGKENRAHGENNEQKTGDKITQERAGSSVSRVPDPNEEVWQGNLNPRMVSAGTGDQVTDWPDARCCSALRLQTRQRFLHTRGVCLTF